MTTLASKIEKLYGAEALELVLLVYINFYYSELEIIDLCSRWIPRRNRFDEKAFLVVHSYDEVRHARLFKEGIKHLGLDWGGLDHQKYRLRDISNRFEKLFHSDDELEVLIGLNLYAEGVLALEEIEQLANHRPDIFPSFKEIYRDELTHVAFGTKVLQRLIDESIECRQRAQLHCRWYNDHLQNYLDKDLASSVQKAAKLKFVSPDYCERVRNRFGTVMSFIQGEDYRLSHVGGENG